MFHTFLPLAKRQNCEQDRKNGWQGSFRGSDRNGAVVESASIDLETGGLDAALAVISVCNRNPRLHDQWNSDIWLWLLLLRRWNSFESDICFSFRRNCCFRRSGANCRDREMRANKKRIKDWMEWSIIVLKNKKKKRKRTQIQWVFNHRDSVHSSGLITRIIQDVYAFMETLFYFKRSKYKMCD